MNKSPFLFNLGDEVIETVTGYKGFIIYRVEYLTGCNQYGLQPPMKKDGTVPDARQVDENRLKLTGKKYSLPAQKPIKVAPGGPNNIIQPQKRIK